LKKIDDALVQFIVLTEMFPNRGLTRMVLGGKFQTMKFSEIMPGRSGDEPASAEEVLARLAESRK
jgi:hypothetical protein